MQSAVKVKTLATSSACLLQLSPLLVLFDKLLPPIQALLMNERAIPKDTMPYMLSNCSTPRVEYGRYKRNMQRSFSFVHSFVCSLVRASSICFIPSCSFKNCAWRRRLSSRARDQLSRRRRAATHTPRQNHVRKKSI